MKAGVFPDLENVATSAIDKARSHEKGKEKVLDNWEVIDIDTEGFSVDSIVESAINSVRQYDDSYFDNEYLSLEQPSLRE